MPQVNKRIHTWLLEKIQRDETDLRCELRRNASAIKDLAKKQRETKDKLRFCVDLRRDVVEKKVKA